MKTNPCLYRGGAALTLATRALELTVTTSVGPRVVSFKSLTGGAGNLFLELPRNDPRLHGYQLRGGHRLWRAPEDVVDSYQPDDDPVEVVALPKGVLLRQPVERGTGLQKAISIEFSADRTVRVVHSLTNLGRKAAVCAPWPVTMLRGGGYGVVPLLPRRDQSGDNLVPTYSIVPWAYTDLSLSVWDLHNGFIGVDVARAKTAQKLGLTDYPGWSAYWNRGTVFVKFARGVPGADHPDRGCRFETYTNGKMIELETLGALVRLAPAKSVAHTEYWTVLEGQPRPDTDRVFAGSLVPAVRAWLKKL